MNPLFSNKHSEAIAQMKSQSKSGAESFKNETLFRKALSMILCPKEWGAALGVSHQKVNQWLGGELISEARKLQIYIHAKKHFRCLKELEQEMDAEFDENFGLKVAA